MTKQTTKTENSHSGDAAAQIDVPGRYMEVPRHGLCQIFVRPAWPHGFAIGVRLTPTDAIYLTYHYMHEAHFSHVNDFVNAAYFARLDDAKEIACEISTHYCDHCTQQH